ncbi:MAG: helix-turn-helix domain-containing protein [Stenotrophobium sp.]
MAKLTGKALAEFERKRDLNAELLQAVRDMRAGRWARKTEFLPRKDGKILRRISLRDGTVESEQVITDESPAAARARTGLSQTRFASVLGVSTRTLQDWEQGRRRPSGAARALLTIATQRPDVFREVLER